MPPNQLSIIHGPSAPIPFPWRLGFLSRHDEDEGDNSAVSDKAGEELAAFVELEKGHTIPADEGLLEWLRASLSRFKTPRYLWWAARGVSFVGAFII